MRFLKTALACLASASPPLVLGALMLSCQGDKGGGTFPKNSNGGGNTENLVDALPEEVADGTDLVCWRGTPTTGPRREGSLCEWDWNVDFTIAGGLASYDPVEKTAGDLEGERERYDYSTLFVLAVQVSFDFVDGGPPVTMKLFFEKNDSGLKREMTTYPKDEFEDAYSDRVDSGTYRKVIQEGFATRLGDDGYPAGNWTLQIEPNANAVTDDGVDCGDYIRNPTLLIIGCLARNSDVLLRADMTRSSGCVFTVDPDPEDFVVLRGRDSKEDTNQVATQFDFHASNPDSFGLTNLTVGLAWVGDGPESFTLTIPGEVGIVDHLVPEVATDAYVRLFTDVADYGRGPPGGTWSLEITEKVQTGLCENFTQVYVELRGKMRLRDIP